MALNSKIEWTSATWNPVTGCTKISLGCQNCYAERMAKRLKAMHNPSYKNGFKVTCHNRMLELPLKWKKPKMIFVNSMSDLFHKDVPLDFIKKVFDVMKKADWHIYQILTKRSERLLEANDYLNWPKHIWMGVTVENAENKHRIDHLRKTNAHLKFISFEPLLNKISKINLKKIDWVIVGGESGPNSRPIEEKWVNNIKDYCLTSRIAFFFKQWGGVNKKKTGRMLNGRIWNEMPEKLKIADK